MAVKEPSERIEYPSYRRIGLFDSGVGGLSVLKELALRDSSEERHFFYFGDTARCPYGDRDATEIGSFVEEIIDFLHTHDVEVIIMACNTSAACALAVAQSIAKVPVVDLISVTAAHVVQYGRKVGVMATASTVKSGLFTKLIKGLAPKMEVREIACPDLVPVIEKGESELPSTDALLRKYADIVISEDIKVLILGCTHFPFVKSRLQRLLPEDVLIVNPAEVLGSMFSSPPGERPAQPVFKYFVSGNPETFLTTAQVCYGDLHGVVQQVDVAKQNAPEFASAAAT